MKKQVWVVDDDEAIVWVLEKALQKGGYEVTCLSDVSQVLERLAAQATRPDVILSDIRMPGESGLWLTEKLNADNVQIPVIIMTAFGDLDSAVNSFKYGAFEYLTKPFDIEEMLQLVKKAVDTAAGNKKPDVPEDDNSRLMLGDSAIMQEIFRIIGRLSASTTNVLIRGESGCGKELVAQALHQSSPRSDIPMVAINTAAIPAELLESELFGHEKGAFTGAHARRIGRFEQSNGGTLFLDEIGDMPPALQTRLLRVLSEGRFFRVGGREEISVDVRVIAATNQNLEQLVEKGDFRLDLFHRLNVISLDVPALRDRIDDIPALCEHFLSRISESLGVERKALLPGTIGVLQAYYWPGNVRELENLMHRLAIMAPGQQITAEDLPEEVRKTRRMSESSSPDELQAGIWQAGLQRQVRQMLSRGDAQPAKALNSQFDRILIEAALVHTSGHRRKAAEALGWGRNTLTRKIQQLELQDSIKSR